MPPRLSAPLLAILCLSLFGCALPPNTNRDPRDPFERVNRATYRFNDAVDRSVTKPIAQTYRRVVPRPVQTGVSNFVDNLGYPVTIVNDLLQGKVRGFARDTSRLVINTTIGIGGIFDVASAHGLEKNEEDFGQTLGKWGLRPGPYIVIPLLGPSDVRDGLGRVADIFVDPRHYISNTWVSYGLWGLGALDLRARLLDADRAFEGVYDRYAFLRNAYLARRQFLVTDGQANEQQQDEQQYEDEKKIIEETEGGEAPPGNPPPGSPPPRNPPPQTDRPPEAGAPVPAPVEQSKPPPNGAQPNPEGAPAPDRGAKPDDAAPPDDGAKHEATDFTRA